MFAFGLARTCHSLSLQKDAPIPRAVRSAAGVIPVPLWADYTTNMFAFEFPTGTAEAKLLMMTGVGAML